MLFLEIGYKKDAFLVYSTENESRVFAENHELSHEELVSNDFRNFPRLLSALRSKDNWPRDTTIGVQLLYSSKTTTE